MRPCLYLLAFLLGFIAGLLLGIASMQCAPDPWASGAFL